METKFSLPCLQEPATELYSEPDESSPLPHILLLVLGTFYYYLSTYA